MSDNKYFTDYCSFMSDIISKGYAWKVDDDLKDQLGRTWYLSHYGIHHPQKPRKIRAVFDYSASFEGHSLNDKLLQGPDFSSNFIGRFPFVRTGRPAHSNLNENFTFHQN